MSAYYLDLLIEHGSNFAHRVTWYSAYTDEEDNTPIDLSDYTARMQVRETYESEETLLELTTENGGIALGGTNGTIDILLSATATAALTFRKAVYDLELVSGTTVTRLIKGEVTVSPEVTR